MVSIQKVVFGENYIKNLQLNHFFSLQKMCYREENIVKQRVKLLNPYLLTVLMSISYNELHCNVPSFHLDFGPSFDGVTIKNNFADIKGKRSFGSR
jgi:hypothetical protein